MNSDYALNFQCGVVQSQSHVSTTGFEAHNVYLLLKTTRVRGMKVNNNKTDWHSIAQILPRATEKGKKILYILQGERKNPCHEKDKINKWIKKSLSAFAYSQMAASWVPSFTANRLDDVLRRSSLEIKSRRRSGNATCGLMSHCDRITPCNAHPMPACIHGRNSISVTMTTSKRNSTFNENSIMHIARPWQPLVL